MPHRKDFEQREARRLRREYGMPMKQIGARLSVSSASVYAWTRDIEITEEDHQRNLRAAAATRGRRWREVWAEGAKERGAVTFSNSDVAMVA